MISLATGPVTGTASQGQVIDVVVGLDPNGTSAANLVSHFVSLGYTGLTRAGAAVNGSIYDGLTVFDGTTGDLIDSSGDHACATPGTCSADIEARGYAREWQSALALLPPGITHGPGSLFSLRLRPSGTTAWSFDVFGDPGAALFWEPPFTCDPADLDCGPQPAAVPFLIVRDTDPPPPSGTARVTVAVRVTTPPPPPVPEPSLVWLTVIALAGWAAHRHARVR
ncbi:hypothetical protein TBR22_A12230 [Luteitalea sp. TBR-22]|nr:hypothetical protein TBR22_A12230 [Luteitalea sp. TBR-22]